MAQGDYGKEPQPQSIPDIRTNRVEAVLEAIKEWIEVRQGARGGGLDRAVTFRDLLNSGIAEPGAIQGLNMPGMEPIPLVPEGGDTSPIPPTPRNLLAAGAVNTIILTWDGGRGYTRLAYYEVWRSLTNALGDAVKVGQVYEPIYSDDVGPGSSYYYWVRAVSDAGMSPYNAVAGTLGITALDVQEVIDVIDGELNDSGLLDQLTIKVNEDGRVTGYGPSTSPSNSASTAFTILTDRFQVAGPAESGVIPGSPFFVQATPATVNGVYVPKGVYMTDAYLMNGIITNAKIGVLAVDDAKISSVSVTKLTAGKLSVGAYIESTNYQSGAVGFHINANGNSEFQNTTVRGTVYATAGTIGGVRIENFGLRTTNYNGASAGWAINAAGDVHFTNGVFRGTVYATDGVFSGSLSAATGTFSGSLSAATGTFAGRVHGGYFTAGSFTGYNWPGGSGTGVYLGPPGLLMGNPSLGRYVQIESGGNMYTPGFSLVNGHMTIHSVDVVDTLQLRGGAVSTTAVVSGYQGSSAMVYTSTPATMIVMYQGWNGFIGNSMWPSGYQVNQNSYVTVNGSVWCQSSVFWSPIGTTGGDADNTIFAQYSTGDSAARAVSAGYHTVAISGTFGGTCVVFMLKR